MKPFPRFTPTPAATSADDDESHDPYLLHPRHVNGWSRLPDRIHLRRAFRLKVRINNTNLPRPHAS